MTAQEVRVTAQEVKVTVQEVTVTAQEVRVVVVDMCLNLHEVHFQYPVEKEVHISYRDPCVQSKGSFFIPVSNYEN